MSQGDSIGDTLSACDRCHSRKVKCDRQQRCANCADAGVECRRVRPGRSRKRPFPGIMTPEEGIFQLERPVPTPLSQRDSHPDDSEIGDGTPLRQRRRIGDQDLSGETPDSGVDLNGNCSNHYAMRARSVIQLELGDSRHTNQKQQSILKAALQLVNQIGEREEEQPEENLGNEAKTATTIEDPVTVPESPPAEMLLMLLHPNDETQWPDHISDQTLEKMAVVLMKDACRGQLFHQYSICVYVKAITHLYHLSRVITSPVVKEQLNRSRHTYIAAASRSIEHFNILTSPSLASIQALISSAMLMQHLGNTKQCWILNSYAAQQIVALGYHRIRSMPARSETEQEIHSAIYWCFYFDRTLSALLVRPTALPDLPFSPTDLIHSLDKLPYGALICSLFDLAQVQGQLLVLASDSNRTSTSSIRDTCGFLEEKMHSIFRDLQSSRESVPKRLLYDWVAADFCYYAIYVEIHRSRLRCSFNPLIHRECLVYARRSLEAFRFLQQNRAELGLDDPYPSFLTWTLFFYPLSSFFVLFCNIIGTLDKDDHELIHQITTGLSQFKRDAHLDKVRDLLVSLERLCESLFHEDGRSSLNPLIPRPAGESSSARIVTLGQEASGSGTGTSADWLMWQLFNTEVPLGWLDPELALL